MPYPIPPTPVAVVAKENPSAPKIVLAAARKTYRLGDPITLTYRIRGVETIPVKPIGGFCTVGESDFSLFLKVTPVRGTLPSLPMHRGRGEGFVKGYARQLTTPHSINANDDVCISRPGDYRVTARFTVLRPAGSVREIVSNTVLIHVADSAAFRAERLRRVRRAARLLQRKNARQETEAAIRALRYVSDAEALPVLLTAFNSDDIGIEESAGTPLVYWHDPQAVYNAAYRWLEQHARKPESFNVLRWASVLQEARLRSRYPAATFGSPTDFATAEEAKATVNRLLLGGVPYLTKGEAGVRRMNILGYSMKPPAPEQLRPLLRDAPALSVAAQKRLASLLTGRYNGVGNDTARAVRAELSALAQNKTVALELRRTAKELIAPTPVRIPQ